MVRLTDATPDKNGLEMDTMQHGGNQAPATLGTGDAVSQVKTLGC